VPLPRDRNGLPLVEVDEATKTKIINLINPDDLDPRDPAYPVVRYVEQLRGEVQEKISAAELAEQEATAAEAVVRRLQFDATVAGVRADVAQRFLNRWAAGMYRDESAAGQIVEIIDRGLDDPAQMLQDHARLRQAAVTRDRQLDDARDLVARAEDSRRAATEQASVARAAAEQALTARGEAEAKLAHMNQVLDVLLGQTVSSQLVIGPDGCPTEVPSNGLRQGAATVGVGALCAQSILEAPTPEAALAIKYAFRAIGAPYACEGIGRWEPFKYDCSSLITRAYSEGAGLATTLPGWIPSTRDLIPWDGKQLAPWAIEVLPADARPGDIVLYETGAGATRHAVILLAGGFMLHTGTCGDVANVAKFWGFQDGKGYKYLISRRVDPQLARRDGTALFPIDDPLAVWQGDSGSLGDG
jgi:cell wall-associated NlpC family hydrolase